MHLSLQIKVTHIYEKCENENINFVFTRTIKQWAVNVPSYSHCVIENGTELLCEGFYVCGIREKGFAQLQI